MSDDKKRAKKIVELLKDEYPEVKIALHFRGAFQLLIATILSAQCTDERVNMVSKDLFKKFKTPQDFLDADIEELKKDIHSTGFFNQKAKSIKNCCKALVEEHKGKVPKNFDKLVAMPGVGRKTASVVVGNAYGIPAIAVDTHVKRLSNLLGFIDSKNPDKIEERLKELVDEKDWVQISHLLATHGRTICKARKPRCIDCVIGDHCPSYDPDNR